MLEVGSVVLAALMLGGTALIAHGRRFGWLYLCVMQLPAGAYDVATHQWGFIVMGFVGGWFYWRGWRRTRSAR